MFDAEHFFDGYKANPKYALSCIKAAYDQGARWIILCDTCLLYTSDAADDLTRVDLGGRRIIKKKVGIKDIKLALPHLSPKPLIVPCIWRTPDKTAAKEFATALPVSL